MKSRVQRPTFFWGILTKQPNRGLVVALRSGKWECGAPRGLVEHRRAAYHPPPRVLQVARILTVAKVHPRQHAMLIRWYRIPDCSSNMRHDIVICPFVVTFVVPLSNCPIFIISQLCETLMIILYTTEFPSFACTLSS